jgi:hypothetical protein
MGARMVRSTLTCAFTLALCFASAAAGATQEPAGELPPATAEAPAPAARLRPSSSTGARPRATGRPGHHATGRAPHPPRRRPKPRPRLQAPMRRAPKNHPPWRNAARKAAPPAAFSKRVCPCGVLVLWPEPRWGALTLAAAGILVAATLNVCHAPWRPGAAFPGQRHPHLPSSGRAGGRPGGVASPARWWPPSCPAWVSTPRAPRWKAETPPSAAPAPDGGATHAVGGWRTSSAPRGAAFFGPPGRAR